MKGGPHTLALTGGSGFIGRRFAAAARARGWRIRQLARRADAGFDPADDYFAFALDGAGEPAPALLEGCSALVHLAARIPGDHRDTAEARRCVEANALGTLRLVESAAAAGCRRIVQTSSANAYAPDCRRPNESAPLFPGSRRYYLGSKILQEIYAAQCCRDAEIALATLRLSSVYGPEQRGGAIARMVSALGAGERVTLNDGGRFGADFVTVDDVTRALLLVLEGQSTGAINVGSGVRHTLAEIAEALARLIDADPGLIAAELPREDGDPGFPALDIERLRMLGFVPTPLDRGLAEMLADRPISPALRRTT